MPCGHRSLGLWVNEKGAVSYLVSLARLCCADRVFQLLRQTGSLRIPSGRLRVGVKLVSMGFDFI